MNPFVIDAFEFCRTKERREDEIAVAGLPRLAQESADKFGTIRWSLQGEYNSLGHPQLTMVVSGTIRLICQRCLRPFDFGIASDTVLVLAENDASADEIDALLADEDVEVIVGTKALDVAELIEDDALLAIPLSPRHDICAGELPPDAGNSQEKVSPFAVLKDWKR